MTGCPFCKRIEHGEWDYGDQWCVSFLPLNPVTPGHFLVVPREHVASALESPAQAAHAMQFAAELAGEMGEGLSAFNFITSAGAAATQTVMHLHVHVVPRHDGDGLTLPLSLSRPRQRQPVAVMAGESERFQVQEARDALSRWDRTINGSAYGMAETLAGHLRGMLAVLDAGVLPAGPS